MTIEISAHSAGLALTGGLLIGAACTILFLFNGRIAGVSGVASRLLIFKRGDSLWRAAFIAGLLIGGFVLARLLPDRFSLSDNTSVLRLSAAGLLVGFGTSLGGGCTSGHGVCGISRLSKRSIVATMTFMLTAFLTVFVLRRLGILP